MNTVLVASPPPTGLDFLQLRYRADMHLLMARWQRPATPAELRQGCAATLQAAEAAACPFWLVDLRGQPMTTGAAEAQWLATEFLPQLPVRLGPAVYLGFLLSPQARCGLAVPGATPGPGTTVQSFDDEGLLTQWLIGCQGGKA